MRYVGQQFHVTVALRLDAPERVLEDAITSFHEVHEQMYGFKVVDEPVEVVNARLRAVGRLGTSAVRRSLSATPAELRVEHVGQRRVHFDGTGDARPVPVYERALIPPGAVLHGPLLVEQDDTTSVVSPGHVVRADEFGNLVVTRGQQ
jgi:N-methylhydantoinase A/oxoprolinase/acetone carboxylase beta subunit